MLLNLVILEPPLLLYTHCLQSLQIEGTKSSRLSPGFVYYTAPGTD